MHVLITGANRGIGKALADRYASAGAKDTGTQRAAGGALHSLDVTDPAAITALAATLGDQTIDLLVCNAGVYADKGQSLDQGYPADMWADGFATNVTGVFLTLQAFLPHLRRAKAGKIAIISSQMASHTRAPGGSYIYRASKAAALNLGRNLATDLAPEGISVGIYHPGWVRTDLGGPNARLSVDEAIAACVPTINALTLEDTGQFRGHDGSTVPW